LPLTTVTSWALQNVASGILLGKVTFVRASLVHSFAPPRGSFWGCDER